MKPHGGGGRQVKSIAEWGRPTVTQRKPQHHITSQKIILAPQDHFAPCKALSLFITSADVAAADERLLIATAHAPLKRIYIHKALT